MLQRSPEFCRSLCTNLSNVRSLYASQKTALTAPSIPTAFFLMPQEIIHALRCFLHGSSSQPLSSDANPNRDERDVRRAQKTLPTPGTLGCPLRPQTGISRTNV